MSEVARNCATNYLTRTIVQTTTRVCWVHSFAPSPLTFKLIIMLNQIEKLELDIRDLKFMLDEIKNTTLMKSSTKTSKNKVKKYILKVIEDKENTIKMLRTQD